MRWLLALCLSLTFMLSGCGSDTSATKDNDFTPLTQIIITSEYPLIADGTTNQLEAIGNYSEIFTRDITDEVNWFSEDSSIAIINDEGLVRATSPGTVQITATLNDIVDVFFLTITDEKISRIDVTPLTPTVSKGLTQQFNAIGTFDKASVQDLTNSVSWSSSSPEIATISESGLAEGIEEGTTSITAAFGTVTDTVSMNVKAAALLSIEVSPTDAEVPQRVGVKFVANGLFSDNSIADISDTVTWHSSDESIATISTKGNFGFATGTNAGSLTITASKDGQSGTANLTITELVLTQINISGDSSVNVNETVDFTATGVFDNNSTADITNNVIWSTGDSDTATISNIISEAGTATGVSPGSSSVTAQSGTITASASLTVN